MALSLLTTLSLARFLRAVDRMLGSRVCSWALWIMALQFHLMFYAGRTLPNIFALAVVMLALAAWIEEQRDAFVAYSAFAVIIFRAELAMLVGPIAVFDLATGRMPLLRFLVVALVSGACAMAATVAVDSYFWRRWLWPEGHVLLFNVVQNRSSEYGTSHFLWYFYSALPKALGAAYPCALAAPFLDSRAVKFLLPALAFVGLFSLLPHKELRFIFYVLPLLSVCAAMAVNRVVVKVLIVAKRGSGATWLIGQNTLYFVVLLAVANFAMLMAFTWTSAWNYPGGVALRALHADPSTSGLSHVSVHLDNFVCQTGASRFGELNEQWTYDKTERLTAAQKAAKGFTHVLVEDGAKEEHEEQGFEAVASVDGLKGFKLRFDATAKHFGVVDIDKAVYIMRNKKNKKAA